MTDTETEPDKQALYAEAAHFLRAVAESPGDPLPRMVFADWLDEHGLHREAVGQRWAAREGKYPSRVEPNKSWSGGWFYALTTGTRRRDSAHYAKDSDVLPIAIWDTDHDGFVSSHGRDDEGPFRAELTFLKACGKVNWDDDGNPR